MHRAAATLAALLLATPALASPEVREARLYLAFGAATSGAAYMVIRNDGGPDDRLLAAASPLARSVTLHGSEETADGVVRMTDLAGGLPLPADGTIEMAPGGLHVMLMGLDGPLAPGEPVPLTLQFESGPLEVALPVEVQGEEAPAAGHGHEGHEGHGGHDH